MPNQKPPLGYLASDEALVFFGDPQLLESIFQVNDKQLNLDHCSAPPAKRFEVVDEIDQPGEYYSFPQLDLLVYSTWLRS